MQIPSMYIFELSRFPEISGQQLATIVADSSERFINENKLTKNKFSWQRSASAHSVSKSDIDKVCKYILHQAEHHKKVTFAEEYEQFIQRYQETLEKNMVIR